MYPLFPSAIYRRFSALQERYPGSPYAVNHDKFASFMNDLGSQGMIEAQQQGGLRSQEGKERL